MMAFLYFTPEPTNRSIHCQFVKSNTLSKRIIKLFFCKIHGSFIGNIKETYHQVTFLLKFLLLKFWSFQSEFFILHDEYATDAQK